MREGARGLRHCCCCCWRAWTNRGSLVTCSCSSALTLRRHLWRWAGTSNIMQADGRVDALRASRVTLVVLDCDDEERAPARPPLLPAGGKEDALSAGGVHESCVAWLSQNSRPVVGSTERSHPRIAANWRRADMGRDTSCAGPQTAKSGGCAHPRNAGPVEWVPAAPCGACAWGIPLSARARPTGVSRDPRRSSDARGCTEARSWVSVERGCRGELGVEESSRLLRLSLFASRLGGGRDQRGFFFIFYLRFSKPVKSCFTSCKIHRFSGGNPIDILLNNRIEMRTSCSAARRIGSMSGGSTG